MTKRVQKLMALLAGTLEREAKHEDAERNQKELAESETLLRHVLKIYTRVGGKDCDDALKAFNNLAFTLVRQDKKDEAMTMFQVLMQKRRQITGLDDIDTHVCASGLGHLLKSTGRHDEALSIYLEFLPIMKRVLGQEHPQTLNMITDYARCLFEIAAHMNRLRSRAEAAKAVAMLESNLAVQQRVQGRDHMDTLRTASSDSAASLAARDDRKTMVSTLRLHRDSDAQQQSGMKFALVPLCETSSSKLDTKGIYLLVPYSTCIFQLVPNEEFLEISFLL